MSGTVHIVHSRKKSFVTNSSFYNSPILPKKHNHVEIIFKDLKLIYNDPRRFGFFKVIVNSAKLSQLFSLYGPEPFSKTFNAVAGFCNATFFVI